VVIRRIATKAGGRLAHVQAVFFDVGGTLVYSDLTHLDLLHQALVVIGYKLARDEVVEANDLARRAVARRRRRLLSRMDTGAASRMWLDHLASALRLDLEGADLERELAAAIRQIETTRVETVDPDAKSLLASLRAKKLRLGVISNWSADLAQYLAKHGLAEYFDTIIASEAVGASKPHKEIFLKGLAALGCPPGNAVHVGDDYWADVVGARDLGMSPVLIDRDHESVHSDCPTIARLKDLEGLLHI
jgi:HAD superfamily hydrolase (TIGR01549 family)